MSSKIGTIIGLWFFFIAICLSVDLYSMQMIYTGLDSLSISLSYDIAKSGTIKNSLKQYVEENYGARIFCDSENEGKVFMSGETYRYYLEKTYDPLFITRPIIVKLVQYTVIDL